MWSSLPEPRPGFQDFIISLLYCAGFGTRDIIKTLTGTANVLPTPWAAARFSRFYNFPLGAGGGTRDSALPHKKSLPVRQMCSWLPEPRPGRQHFSHSRCYRKNKIYIYKNEEEEEEEDCFKLKETLQHKNVLALVETNNGMFISGSYGDKNIKIWQPSSSLFW